VVQEKKIPEEELMAYRAELRGDLFRQIHRKLREMKAKGFTQYRMAVRLGIEPSQLSRVLRGDTDIRLETLSDLARALGCRVRSTLAPLTNETVTDGSYKIEKGWRLARPSEDTPGSADDRIPLQ
jgi:transcriptional regulator with XRE-family HTH domain